MRAQINPANLESVQIQSTRKHNDLGTMTGWHQRAKLGKYCEKYLFMFYAKVLPCFEIPIVNIFIK